MKSKRPARVQWRMSTLARVTAWNKTKSSSPLRDEDCSVSFIGLNYIAEAEAVRISEVCRPHSILALPDQRPARSSSPAWIGRVQGAQPILAYPWLNSGWV